MRIQTYDQTGRAVSPARQSRIIRTGMIVVSPSSSRCLCMTSPCCCSCCCS